MVDLFYKPKYFDTYKKTQDYGRTEFYKALYHEMQHRRGSVIQAVLDGGECKAVKCAYRLDKIINLDQFFNTANDTYSKNANFYTTVNTFNKPQRTSENMRYRTAFFLDIDLHTKSGDYDVLLDARKKETAAVLEDAFDKGQLPIPTMIVDTGRGYAMYYVLKHSIANTPKAAKIQNFFNLIYNQLAKKTNQLLSAAKNPLVGSVDMKVYDNARLCRIPGTYNAKADEMCKVSYINYDQNGTPTYFELSDIASFVLSPKQTTKAQNVKPTRKTRAEVKDSGLGFCYARVQMLEKLQTMRGSGCDNNCREQMLFILYNTLVPVYGTKEAFARIEEFNAKFTTPLSEKELKNVPNSAAKVTGNDGHVGYYKLTNKYIVTSLGMTKDEIKVIGLGKKRRDKERQAKREEKMATLAKIEDLLRNTTSDTMTYAQIAELNHVSEITVKRFAKKLGIVRHAYPSTISHKIGSESITSAPRFNVSPTGCSMAQPCKPKNEEQYDEELAHNPFYTVYKNDKCTYEQMLTCSDDEINTDVSSNDKPNLDLYAFLNAWEYRLADKGWAGDSLYKKINEIVDIADKRNWDVYDMAAHLNSNLHLYQDWEDTYILSTELDWLKAYLRNKRKQSWKGPKRARKKSIATQEFHVEPNKSFDFDKRFCTVTVKNYPWLDSKWIRILMHVFRTEWKTPTYTIDGVSIDGAIIDTCFAAMTTDDIVTVLERLCNYNGEIKYPHAFIVKMVYKLKKCILKQKGTIVRKYQPETEDSDTDFDIDWDAYLDYANDAEEQTEYDEENFDQYSSYYGEEYLA